MSERDVGESVAVRSPWRILFLRNGHASAAGTLLRLPRSPKFITASRYKSTQGREREKEREIEGGRGRGKRGLYHRGTLALLFARAFHRA